MKTIILVALTLICPFTEHLCAQNWGGFPVKKVMDNSVLIFEGKVLSDSIYFQAPPGIVSNYHHVLVLKQFKGVFSSDTIVVVNFGGRMSLHGALQGDRPDYVHAGDEAIFLVNTEWNKTPNSPAFYFIGYGDGCGFVKICDKKDAKELYEQIENVVGQNYLEIHPNTCKGK